MFEMFSLGMVAEPTRLRAGDDPTILLITGGPGSEKDITPYVTDGGVTGSGRTGASLAARTEPNQVEAKGPWKDTHTARLIRT